MTRKSVLIVDDDPDIRDVLADTLESKGFDVVTAANGADALTVLCDTGVRPSVILLDLMMPVMDGYGFLERWRRDPALASIPIAIDEAIEKGVIKEGSTVMCVAFGAGFTWASMIIQF